jgi:hypothetical protein
MAKTILHQTSPRIIRGLFLCQEKQPREDLKMLETQPQMQILEVELNGRSYAITALRNLRRTMQELANDEGVSLLDYTAPIPFVLIDVINALALTGSEAAEILGSELMHELQAEGVI